MKERYELSLFFFIEDMPQATHAFADMKIPLKRRKDADEWIDSSVKKAILSHLSDCQEMLSLADNREYVIKKMNFVKQLVLTYPDTSIEVSEKELNEIWNKTM